MLAWLHDIGEEDSTVVLLALALLAYEARLAARGLGGMLQVPADPIAVRAAEALRAGEA